MGSLEMLGIIVAALLMLAAATYALTRQHRQRTRARHLRGEFGPEYDYTLRRLGSRRAAVRELDRRHARVRRLHLRELREEDAQYFSDRWLDAQTRFVDDPLGAIAGANEIVKELMHARGYPIREFEQRAADLSVDHPQFVQSYRAAHAIAERATSGMASTEDLRRALVHYRAIFADLLGDTRRTPDPGPRRLSHAT